MESRVCGNCGTIILPGDKFCLRCGKPVKMTVPSGIVSNSANSESVSVEYNADEQISNDLFSGQRDSWSIGKTNRDYNREGNIQEYGADTGQTNIRKFSDQQYPVSTEPQGNSISSTEAIIQDGMRKYLSTNQESWNRWMQSNIAWLEEHKDGGRKENTSKRWPFHQ